MKRSFKWFVFFIVGLTSLGYGVSFVWPVYDWAIRLPSPNGVNDVVVLRSNAAAFADFGYAVYVFPHPLTPADRPKGTRVLFTPIWRSDKYRIFDSYSYPMLRWTDDNSLEINLNEVYYGKILFDPVKRFSSSDKPILISLVFNKKDDGMYTMP
jgi:hypothetical protein